APFLASFLKLSYLGVITEVSFDEESQTLSLVKEFAGGLRGEFEAPLPAILGIQAAEKPPRYVPVAKIRGAMRSAKIESLSLDVEPVFNLEVKKMYKPIVKRAEIIEGSPEEVAAKIYEILAKCGVLKGVAL
ncbi:MAG: electron transfer flavoprotein subunit beta, partial [Candidatus Methanofastidiosia archaeon]